MPTGAGWPLAGSRPSILILSKGKAMNLKTRFLNFAKDEQGAELAEYAVAVALLVAIAIIVYRLLGNAINDSNSGTAAKVANAKTDAGF